jgi:hypothetical protein
MQTGKGYLASIIGAATGGIVAVIIVSCAVAPILLARSGSIVVFAALSAVPSLFAGSVVGSWIALRWSEYPRAGTTARYLACLLIVHSFVIPLAIAGTDLSLRMSTWIVWLVIHVVVLPLLARWLVLPLSDTSNQVH